MEIHVQHVGDKSSHMFIMAAALTPRGVRQVC